MRIRVWTVRAWFCTPSSCSDKFYQKMEKAGSVAEIERVSLQEAKINNEHIHCIQIVPPQSSWPPSKERS
jgi:REP element-mobilizing transposase RayT